MPITDDVKNMMRDPAAQALELGMRRTLDKVFADWFDDKTAEYQMRGYDLTAAKEKAMSDWHTYEAANDTG